jgi:CRP-like cAMP-binding protein
MTNRNDHRIEAALLAAGGTTSNLPADAKIIHQGDPADWLYYVVSGKVQISVTSKQGKEGLVGPPLADGDFIGESSLTSQAAYLSSAHATTDAEIIRISRAKMSGLLKSDPIVNHAFSDFLLRHGLNIQAELVDHLFNSTEKRLARTLLQLANFDHEGRLEPINDMTQALLAHRVGTTRGRISFFMNKFRRLGLIDYNGAIHVHGGLLNVVLNDSRLDQDDWKPPSEPETRPRSP